jgi:hypothetical protein
MPIIINEFEIITDQPSSSAGQGQTPSTSAPLPPSLQPQDIERIQCRLTQRMERVRAD